MTALTVDRHPFFPIPRSIPSSPSLGRFMESTCSLRPLVSLMAQNTRRFKLHFAHFYDGRRAKKKILVLFCVLIIFLAADGAKNCIHLILNATVPGVLGTITAYRIFKIIQATSKGLDFNTASHIFVSGLTNKIKHE